MFIHGLLVGGDLWRNVVPELGEGLRAITPDWPLGAHELAMHDDADLSIPRLARLIAESLEALDLDDVVLVANDTGGALTQLVLTEHRERVGAAVLTSCDCYENFLPPLFKPLLATAHVPPVLRLVFELMRLRPLRRLPFALGWLSKRAIPNEIVVGWVARGVTDAGVRRDVAKVMRGISPRYTMEAARHFSEVEFPILLAWATEDRLFPLSDARKMEAAFHNARLETIDDAYTFVSEDQPLRVAQLVREFALNQSQTSADVA
ncbi:MAG: pimeloyl-ACP methyl ester carboxylesterase [Hyphomicrobiaceae bacterium]